MPSLTGPVDEPSSWLTWLCHAFEATPDRFRHSVAVWQRAVDLGGRRLPWLGPAMADRLELAALLHDVGRALDPHDTEPHGFAGARFLDEVGLAEAAPLVAHHSGARTEARERGMSDRDQWSDAEPDLLAVLTLLDRTTSETGERVTVAQRRDGVVARYGPGSLNVRVFDATVLDLRRAEQLLGTS
jgi:hypothetical protein